MVKWLNFENNRDDRLERKTGEKLTEDFIRNEAFEGANAANPDTITLFFARGELGQRIGKGTLITSGLKWRIDLQQAMLDNIKKSVECFRQWAYQQANGDNALRQETDNYINSLYEWLKNGREKGQLDVFECQRLVTQKASLIDKLSKKASGKEGDAKGTETKTALAKVPISELIKQGESQTLEFKETLEYDTEEKKKNKDILHSSLKTIAGFLNTEGGTLLIGVHDSGKIEGIKRDLCIMNRGSNDKFEQKIRNCLKDRFKPQPIGKVNISFEEFTEGTICRVDVQDSKDVVHLDGKVYVREGNTTLLLEGPTLTDWIQQRSN